MKAAMLAMGLALLGQAKDRPSQGNGPDPGAPAPDFTLKTQDGTSEIRLSKLRGRPVLLIFGSYT
ncbi:MAG TPA: hypothetical protein VEJ18_20015 [Planctomycetota bacterium]|nr:hypothetical protein [Planctomycetota bacterium]